MREAGGAAYLSKESAGQELYRMIVQIVRLHQKFTCASTRILNSGHFLFTPARFVN